MNRYRLIFVFTLLFGSVHLYASNEEPNPVPNKRQHLANKVSASPSIDGNLDEEVWKQAGIASDFIQGVPIPGGSPSNKTEVRIIYDDNAIYIGATMYEVSSDSIMKGLSERDDIGNTDWFGVFFDPYQDGINGFGFIVSAAGVQFDAKYSSSGESNTWNAVWNSDVQIYNDRWVAEYKIPYSALRFSQEAIQTWGLNFTREIRRNRERVWWSEVKPEVDGFLNQAGELVGIEGIEPPVRLSFTPYLSGQVEIFTDKDLKTNSVSRSFSGGMDLKYGITDAFTLDMTLVPDYGQVRSDNQVLNLTPFEVFFQENRQFFTEGTELFSKGNLFYSRRVGGRPLEIDDVEDKLEEGETIVKNPTESQLINATKISGRTTGGLGIGVFNAVEARMNAKVEDENEEIRKINTNPLTNYNVLVFDQSMKNNSYLSFINTNVLREGKAYDANVTGTEFSFRNKKNNYKISGGGAVSQKFFDGFDDVGLGYKYYFYAGKSSGNFQYGFDYNVESDTYDPNDLGFLSNNNERYIGTNVRYNIYKPFGIYNSMYNSIWINYSRLYDPSAYQNFGIYAEHNATFKNFLSYGLWTNLEPLITYDYFEPRVDGRVYVFPKNYNIGTWFSSDYSKKMAIDVRFNYRSFNEEGRYRLNYGISPRWQVNDKVNFVFSFDSYNFLNDVGYATELGDTVIFGVRDRRTIENVLSGNYIFNNNMSIRMDVRHYWSRAEYISFHVLSEDGYLAESDYSGLDQTDGPIHDVNFNAFNIDFVYRWIFLPGSELNVVWKNAIFTEDNNVDVNFTKNFGNTIQSSQTNIISVKFLYFLDYLSLKKNKA